MVWLSLVRSGPARLGLVRFCLASVLSDELLRTKNCIHTFGIRTIYHYLILRTNFCLPTFVYALLPSYFILLPTFAAELLRTNICVRTFVLRILCPYVLLQTNFCLRTFAYVLITHVRYPLRIFAYVFFVLRTSVIRALIRQSFYPSRNHDTFFDHGVGAGAGQM